MMIGIWLIYSTTSWLVGLATIIFHAFHTWLFKFNSFGIIKLKYQNQFFETLGAFADNHFIFLPDLIDQVQHQRHVLIYRILNQVLKTDHFIFCYKIILPTSINWSAYSFLRVEIKFFFILKALPINIQTKPLIVKSRMMVERSLYGTVEFEARKLWRLAVNDASNPMIVPAKMTIINSMIIILRILFLVIPYACIMA